MLFVQKNNIEIVQNLKENMNKPFLILLAAAGGALAWSVLRTVKAGTSLNYRLRKLQLYQFVNGNMMVLKLTLRITNSSNTDIHVQMIDLDACYEPKFTEEDEVIKVTDKGTILGSITDVEPFVIPANNLVDKELYIECKWINIAKVLATSAIDILTNHENALQYFLDKNFLLTGVIKAESVQIQIQNVISLTN